MQNTVLLNEGAAVCASWVAWFSVPGKGEPQCSAVPKTLLLGGKKKLTDTAGIVKQTTVGLGSLPSPSSAPVCLQLARQGLGCAQSQPW